MAISLLDPLSGGQQPGIHFALSLCTICLPHCTMCVFKNGNLIVWFPIPYPLMTAHCLQSKSWSPCHGRAGPLWADTLVPPWFLPTGLPCSPLLTPHGSWCRSHIPAVPSAKTTLVQRPEPHFPKFLFREAYTDHFIKNSAHSTPTWRREWQPTPVFLPGEFRGQRSLAVHSPWGCKESDMT